MRTRRNNLRYILWMVLTMIAIITTGSSCKQEPGSEEQLLEDADSFAVNYFNWHFEQALRYCTPESEKWLRYAASNVHEADVELLRNKEEDAQVELGDIIYNDNDSIVTIETKVYDYLQMDSIGKAAHLVPESTFRLTMVKRSGKWLIRMESTLRSEKQSHD